MGWREVAEQRVARLAAIDADLLRPEVLRDQARIAPLRRERRGLETLARVWAELRRCQAVIDDTVQMQAGEDRELAALAAEEEAGARRRLPALEAAVKDALVARDADASRDTIVEIRAGTGGEEAALFARDLFRVYSRYADARRWKVEIVDAHPSDLGGLRAVTFEVKGEDVFHALRFESGGHRVQRVPVTEAQGRIHTSLCTVAVLPQAEEVEVELDPKDLDITIQCASGPGGQKVNKTSSAVRIIHVPTGLMAYCQDEKSQHKNKDKAMRVLRGRLYDQMRRAADAARAADRRAQIGSGDRAERVRTYNFPQNRCTDHRLEGDEKDYPLDAVLDGRLDPLITALHAARTRQALARLT